MLILTRRCAEAIVIDDQIEVVVLSVEGERVKLGITAPAEISVLRKELCAEIRAENREAALQARDAVAGVLRGATPRKFRIDRRSAS